MKKKILITVVLCLFLSSCSNLQTIESKKDKISSINFFKADPPSNGKLQAYPTALIAGYLVLKNNCLYLSHKDKLNKKQTIISWPWNFSLKQTQNDIHIINGKNEIIARIGEYVKFGGAGLSVRDKRFKNSKFQNCINKNVTYAWFASPTRIK